MPIGEFLVRKGLVTDGQIRAALKQQKKTGGRLGEILQAATGIRSLDYYKALSVYYGLDFVDLTQFNPDTSLLNEQDRHMYASGLLLPVGTENGQAIVATADPNENTFKKIRDTWGPGTRIVATAKFDIFSILQKTFNKNYSHEIMAELYENDSTKSAKNTFTPSQKYTGIGLLIMFSLVLYVSYPFGVMALNTFLTMSITGVLLFKFTLTAIGMKIHHEKEDNQPQTDERILPVYTILVPLRKEKLVTIEHLSQNLQLLNYPAHKLDIKLVLEYDDFETIQIVKDLRLPSYFEIVLVPHGSPRTKPRACNYALKFARGEYITIFDAEDRPDPNQLKSAIKAFRDGGERLACVQCCLNYYNSKENWLTRMFTMEYTFWFDLMLPALSKLNAPIPLGGTSNHFKTALLKQMVAWDPFNVTEDADLGIRMGRLGYISRVIPSTTYEEANCKISNWIKQRTRWIKGYMQTYLVHMRNPVKLIKDLGGWGFLSFQFFVGGTVVSNLANIVLLLIFIASLIFGYSKVSNLFPSPTLQLAWFNLIAGNLLLILFNLMGVLRRRMYSIMPYVLTAPIYWLLASFASYRALYQLFSNPSYWEKTEHGISSVFVSEKPDTIKKM
ncbi:MAG: glycosyltransferase [Actinomycetota bacterium]|nr:glycosyltransferase [Actinomycetota bacterium]